MLANENQDAANQHTPLPVLPDGKRIDFSSKLLQGFIKHPSRFPLEYKRLRFWERSRLEMNNASTLGLTFFSEQHERTGSILEITIPTRKETHRFMAKVVAVKEYENGYDIGVWLLQEEDVPKLRIIEQICHIELYLNDKKYREGPFLSQEKITEEWIGKFASQFPVN